MSDFNKLLAGIKNELADEFDRNLQNNKSGLLVKTGALRDSITAHSDQNSATFSSSLPYAKIHNEGGKIAITSRMKRYFWAMYMQASNGGKNDTSREAQVFKAMALKKVGSLIIMPERRFMDLNTPIASGIIKTAADSFIREVTADAMKSLNNI